MSLDELISVISLIFYTVSITMLTLITLHQAHERWGMPFPRQGFLKRLCEKWIRHITGANGRWKLDWTVTAFLAIIAVRNLFTIKYLIVEGRPATNWTFTVLYIMHAVVSLMLIRYIRIENAHRKEEPHE